MIVIHMPNAQDQILPAPTQPHTLLSLLQTAGIFAAAPCGGTGRCGNCRIQARGDLSQPDDEERRLLGGEALQRGIRLACRAQVIGPSIEVFLGTEASIAAPKQNNSKLTPMQPLGNRLGLAVDLGTTTIAGALYDLQSGDLLAEDTIRNPQATFGADVISRLMAARTNPQALADAAGNAIRDLTQHLLQTAGYTELPDAAVLTANTAMLCLLFGYPVRSLAHTPFSLPHKFGETHALSVLLPNANGVLYVPPCIGPFLGADIVTALLDTDLTHAIRPTALLDLGTNGEIALFDGKTLRCCSTAAGPAFEGAGIRMGCTASAGAIHRVTQENGMLHCDTIGNVSATGLCGSGLLDAIACLLEMGHVDASGRLQTGERIALGNTDVFLYGQDIRAIQMAKAAVRAGLECLLAESSIAAPELLLAGGFGSSLRVESAACIGLIPRDAASRTRSVGNAALQGAAKLLMNTELQQVCREITEQAVVLDLAANPDFTDQYIDQMQF